MMSVDTCLGFCLCLWMQFLQSFFLCRSVCSLGTDTCQCLWTWTLSWHAAELVVLLICIRTLYPAHICKSALACARVGESVYLGLCVGIFLGVCPPVRWMADGLFCVFSSCLELRSLGPLLRRVWDSGEGPSGPLLLTHPSLYPDFIPYSFSVLPSMTPAPFFPFFLPFSQLA